MGNPDGAHQPPSEPPHHYAGTIAPLVVRDMVVVGVSGADAGIRGFVAAFNAESGALCGGAGPYRDAVSPAS